MNCKHERIDEDYIDGSWSFCRHCNQVWSNQIQKEFEFQTKRQPQENAFFQVPQNTENKDTIRGLIE